MSTPPNSPRESPAVADPLEVPGYNSFGAQITLRLQKCGSWWAQVIDTNIPLLYNASSLFNSFLYKLAVSLPKVLRNLRWVYRLWPASFSRPM